MRRWLVLALVLLPASLSAQSLPGSPFGGGSGSGFGLRVAICGPLTLSNTSGTVQTVATVTTTTATGGSAAMYFTTLASNGSLVDTESGLVNVAWNNAAGTVAAGITGIVVNAGSDGSGTITSIPTVAVATNVVSIKTTPTWTTIVPTSVLHYAVFFVNGVDSVTCQ